MVLDAPAASKWPGITPAPLLPVGTLDANQGALKNATFTLVGYGVDIGAKKAQIVVPERRFTTSFLKNVQTEVVTFQINDRDSKAGGGSCFGDSGGPAFLGQYVIGDASYVNSLTCNATGWLPAGRHGLLAGLPGAVHLGRRDAAVPVPVDL